MHKTPYDLPFSQWVNELYAYVDYFMIGNFKVFVDVGRIEEFRRGSLMCHITQSLEYILFCKDMYSSTKY